MGIIIAVIVIFLSGLPAAETKICPNAPLPRLVIGQRAQVAAQIERLRLRALPAVGTGEVDILHGGNAFEVIAGPSCNGGFAWWRVLLDNGTSGWVAEGDWDLYYLLPAASGPRPFCQRADAPWLHLLLTAGCKIVGAV